MNQAPSLAPGPAAGPAVGEICELSPHGRAFSTILTAFVGAMIGGVSGGSYSAFFISWICWFGTLRILVIGLWAVAKAFRLRPLSGFLEGDKESDPDAPLTFFGWVGWLYSTCYAPTSQILWLVGNWNAASGGLKLVRALGVTVTALPLTMDTKARYGAALEARLGRWSRCLFSLIASGACLVLGVIAAIELVVGAIELKIKWYFILIYILYLLGWTVCSVFWMPRDGGEPHLYPTDHKFVDGLMWGAFTGCFTGFPALILTVTAKKTPGLSVGEYIRCKPVALWRKFICIFP